MVKRVIYILIFTIFLFAEAAAETITLSFIGDCTIGGIDTKNYLSSAFTRYLHKNQLGKDYPFFHFTDLFHNDDLTIANCEGVFTSKSPASKSKLNLRATAEWAEVFALGGIDIVNTTNNHTFDYGKSGYNDTLKALQAYGVNSFGGGELCITEVKGIKIGFTGYSYPHRFDIKRQEKDIEQLRGQGCDLIIVSMHWGREGNPKPTPEQRELGPRLIDAGADIVFGHGPHVLQPIELYKGKIIFYSLANFVFGANPNPQDPDTAVIQVTLRIDQTSVLEKITAIPARMHVKGNFQPIPYDSENDMLRVYKKLVFNKIDESRMPGSFLSTGTVILP